MRVICISGKAQHGKDTTAGYLKDVLEERGNRVLIAHYGDLVKYICKTFFEWDGNKDETGRNLLQYVGTDVVRTQDPDYWVRFIGSILRLFRNEWDYVLIPDCRFPNEIEYIRQIEQDITHIRIVRNDPYWTSPLTKEQQNHPSETALDGYRYDYIVYNDSDLEQLEIKIRRLASILMLGVVV